MNKIPLEVMDMAVSYLNMDDTLNLARTSKHFRRLLNSHLETYQEIKAATKDYSIYGNYDLLKVPYEKCQNHVVELNGDKYFYRQINKISKFKTWDQIGRLAKQDLDRDNVSLLGVFKILCLIPNIDQSRAIEFGSKYGYQEVVTHSLSAGVDPSINHNIAIRVASVNGHFEIVKLLLKDSRVDPAAIENVAIRCASKYGHFEIVKLLLKDSRVDPAANENAAIRCASENGHFEIVELLLKDSRVDPAANENAAIRLASAYSHSGIVKLLLKDSRVDPAANENVVIRCASKYGHFEIVKLLLKDYRVDPAANENAAIRQALQIAILELLIKDSRVDPAANSNEAIRQASRFGCLSIVQLLLSDSRVIVCGNFKQAINAATEKGYVVIKVPPYSSSETTSKLTRIAKRPLTHLNWFVGTYNFWSLIRALFTLWTIRNKLSVI